ncbi:MAG: nicotinamide mononucleotide transporter [Saprospiraceae bacterium]|nr:nicotinamide mononucleotide transporter [Saprospiraceae bacterium]
MYPQTQIIPVMDKAHFLQILMEQIRLITPIEVLSTVSQVISVWFAQKNSVWVYPTGIIGVLLAAYLYFFLAEPPLYAEGSVHCYYFVLSCYGWYLWVQKKNDNTLMYPIQWSTPDVWKKTAVLSVVNWMGIYLLLKYMTDSDTPWMDSFVSAMAITAMWLMAARKIENWLFWMVSNVVAIPLHLYKSFYLFSLMFFLFLVMTIAGFFSNGKK